MNDPHVESLEYRLEVAESLTFNNPPPRAGETEAFKWRLAGGRLTVTMKEHYATVPEARAVVRPFLRAWELDAALTDGRQLWRFEFKRSKVAGMGARASLVGVGVLAATGGHVGYAAYPAPPTAFAVSPDVETLWDRYEGFKLGREHLPGMGYFCLTMIQFRYSAGTWKRRKGSKGRQERKGAADALSISGKVLTQLKKLTVLGSLTMVRKMTSDRRDLTPQELAWIEAVVKAIIRRVAMKTAGVAPPPLTMGDDSLPKL